MLYIDVKYEDEGDKSRPDPLSYNWMLGRKIPTLGCDEVVASITATGNELDYIREHFNVDKKEGDSVVWYGKDAELIYNEFASEVLANPGTAWFPYPS